VREHDAPRPGRAGVRAGLGRGQVPAVAVALGAGQRGLDEQQVGVAREGDQLVGRAVVGAVGQAPAGGGGDLDRVGWR
jgi:hypothetical protein